jgi:hypothetical protein
MQNGDFLTKHYLKNNKIKKFKINPVLNIAIYIGYVGCFQNDMSNPQFTSYAAHMDESQITPQLCSSACSAIGYNLAAMSQAKWCFCKLKNDIAYTKVDDSNCNELACAGDASLTCGSSLDAFWMVYIAGPLSKV